MLSTSRSAERVFSTTPETPISSAARTNGGAASHVYSTTWRARARRGPSRPPGPACGGARRTCRTGRRRPARVGMPPASSSTTAMRLAYGASIAATPAHDDLVVVDDADRDDAGVRAVTVGAGRRAVVGGRSCRSSSSSRRDRWSWHRSSIGESSAARDDRPLAGLLDGHVVAQAPDDAEAPPGQRRAAAPAATRSTGGIAAAEPALATTTSTTSVSGDLDVRRRARRRPGAGG